MLKKIILLSSIILSLFCIFIWISTANHDYVCTQYVSSSCECEWSSPDSNWVQQCIWTMYNIKKIWNTRTWCPSTNWWNCNYTWFDFDWVSVIMWKNWVDSNNRIKYKLIMEDWNWWYRVYKYIWYNFWNYVYWSTDNNWFGEWEYYLWFDNSVSDSCINALLNSWEWDWTNNENLKNAAIQWTITNNLWNEDSTEDDSWSFEWDSANVLQKWFIVKTYSCQYTKFAQWDQYDNTSCVWDTTPPNTNTDKYTPSTCTNWNVVVKHECTSDNACGCRDNPNNVLSNTINNEPWQGWEFKISDKIWNWDIFSWNVNWIDRKAPYNIWFEIVKNLAWEVTYRWKWQSEKPVWCNRAEDSQLTFNINITWPQNRTYSFKVSDNWSFWPENSIDLTKAWEYIANFSVSDSAWNITNWNSYNFTVFPNLPSETTSSIDIISMWNKFANNSDYYEYKLTLKDIYWNSIYWKEVDFVEQDWEKTIKNNMLDFNNPDWEKAIIWWFNNWQNTNSNWELNFTMKSLAPWNFSNNYKFTMNKWNEKYIDYWQSLNFKLWNWSILKFKKPFVWSFESDNNNINIWVVDNIDVVVSRKENIDINDYIIYHFDNKNYIKSLTPWYFVYSLSWKNEYVLTNKEQNRTNWEIIVNYSSWEKVDSINLEWEPWIKYSIWWKNITYKLWSDEYIESQTIATNWVFIWAKIVWIWQSAWKQEQTNLDNINTSKISSNEIKNHFRKKSNEITRWINHWEKNKWVMMFNLEWWEIRLSQIDLKDVKTLVIFDWNIIIDKDQDELLWLILVSQEWWYYNSKQLANIIIENNVKFINMLIYTDWSVFWKQWNEQLVLKWTIISNNTLWWAITWEDWNYVLPWWTKSTSYEDASKYDLNYVRRWNNNPDSTKNEWYNNYTFVIIYDWSYQQNPPPGFN